MSLLNLYEYQSVKTVKLSDSYKISIKLSEQECKELNIKTDDNSFELFNCISVKLPTVEYNEETYNYGNHSKAVYIANPESLSDLELEFTEFTYNKNYEYIDASNNRQAGIKKSLFMKDMVNCFLNKLFDTEYFTYKMLDYIESITVSIFDNNFTSETPEAVYTFRNLKLTDYTKYGLDYSSDDLCKWTLKFSYMSYSIETFNAIGQSDNSVLTTDIYSKLPNSLNTISNDSNSDT